MNKQKKSKGSVALCFLILLFGLAFLVLYAMKSGSLQVSFGQLFRGLFFHYDETVAAILDLRFPRIFISLLAGSALAVSGCLLQAVLQNPLADPGIIGVSGGAQCAASLVLLLMPQWFFFTPILAFLGGLFAFALVYLLAIRGGMKPLRILLIGVAINAMFTGFVQSFSYMSGQIMGAMPGLTLVNIGMKGWSDVQLLLYYVPLGLILAFLSSRWCNLLLLQEQTVESLGVHVHALRLVLSILAVLLSSITTATVGVIAFLALIVPHVARVFVGHDHRRLLPFAALMGAFVFLLCDTLGRVLFAPLEIPAGILMTVLGGPVFVFLLRRGGRVHRG